MYPSIQNQAECGQHTQQESSLHGSHWDILTWRRSSINAKVLLANSLPAKHANHAKGIECVPFSMVSVFSGPGCFWPAALPRPATGFGGVSLRRLHLR